MQMGENNIKGKNKASLSPLLLRIHSFQTEKHEVYTIQTSYYYFFLHFLSNQTKIHTIKMVLHFKTQNKLERIRINILRVLATDLPENSIGPPIDTTDTERFQRFFQKIPHGSNSNQTANEPR